MPCVMDGRSSCGNVKKTAMGSSCVTTTRPVVSLGCTTFPGSTRRTPVTPSMGDVILAYTRFRFAAAIWASSAWTCACSCATDATWSVYCCVAMSFWSLSVL